MSPAEHGILGFLLMSTAVAFFVIAVPGYWIIRRLWPESGWNLGGSVPTSCIRIYDLIAVGLLVSYFGLQWKHAGGGAVLSEDITAGGVFGSSLFYLMVAGLALFLLMHRTHLPEFLGLRWVEWRRIFFIIPAFIVGIFISAHLLQLSGWHERIQSAFGSQQQDAIQILQKSQDVPLLLAISFSAVIVAPIAEEILFRGYVYPVAKRYSEKWFAAIFSASLFGVVHMNLLGLPMLVLIGLILVILYEKTGSIWPCILCHMAFNGLNVGLIFLARFLQAPLPS